MSDNDKKQTFDSQSASTSHDHEKPVERNMKEELSELIKPIAIHEAKSAIYKAKLAGYVLKKGAQGASKAAKYMHEKTSAYLDDRKEKKSFKRKIEDLLNEVFF